MAPTRSTNTVVQPAISIASQADLRDFFRMAAEEGRLLHLGEY
jgi:hypothetical protein